MVPKAVTTCEELLACAAQGLAMLLLDPSLARRDLADAALAARRSLEKIAAAVGQVVHQAAVTEAWREHGAVAAVPWLAAGAGIHPGKAKAELAAGMAIAASSQVAAAVEAGDLSTDQASALSKAVSSPAFEEHGGELLDRAPGLSPSALADEVRRWNDRHDPLPDPGDIERSQRRKRSLRHYRRDDGMIGGSFLLTAADGTTVLQALAHLTAGQQDDGSDRTADQRSADALVELCAAYNSGAVTGGREKPELLATVTLADLEARSGTGRLLSGGTLEPGALRRILCDARITRIVLDQDSQPLDVGRTSRTRTPAQWRALVVRDGGCVVPGCGRPAGWCDAHHWRTPWERGGLTNLDDLGLVCGSHHHLVHDDGWDLRRRKDGTWVLLDPTGRVRSPGRSGAAPPTAGDAAPSRGPQPSPPSSGAGERGERRPRPHRAGRGTPSRHRRATRHASDGRKPRRACRASRGPARHPARRAADGGRRRRVRGLMRGSTRGNCGSPLPEGPPPPAAPSRASSAATAPAAAAAAAAAAA